MTTPGKIDTSFGKSGKNVITPQNDKLASLPITFPGLPNPNTILPPPNPINTIVEPSGKTIALSGGSFLVNGKNTSSLRIQRFNPNGSLDSSFKTVTRTFANGSTYGQILRQNDGSILLVAEATPVFANSSVSTKFTITKYKSDGNLDTSFGSGGTLTSSAYTGFPDAFRTVRAANGKILVAGLSGGKLTLELYNSNGSKVTSFGTNGKSTITPGIPGNSVNQGIATALIQADGKIVLGTVSGFIVRVNAKGAIDTTFGTKGVAVGIRTDQILRQKDGKLILISKANSIDTIRLNADGTPDTTFTKIPSPGNDNVGLLQSDGKILIGSRQGGNFVITRYNSTGKIDTTFGTKGSTKIDFGQDDVVKSLAIDSKGRIFAAGTSSTKFLSTALFTGPLAPATATAVKGYMAVNAPTTAGDDTYSFNTALVQPETVINEALNGGIDTLAFSGDKSIAIDLSQTTRQTVNENLVLQVVNIENVTGGNGNDTIAGNSQNNSFTGGKGKDTFVFGGSSLKSLGVDTISDFTSGEDRIRLSSSLFGNLVAGTLAAKDFEIVTNDADVATSAAAIVYNSTTGQLFYNQNGSESGFGTGGQFATLSSIPTIASSDFLIG
jgi:uncharacterized delta-60 repeat protein